MIKELTFKMAKKKGLNWIGCVKYYWPHITDETADYILWNETCFPFDDDTTLKQLYAMYKDKKTETLKVK